MDAILLYLRTNFTSIITVLSAVIGIVVVLYIALGEKRTKKDEISAKETLQEAVTKYCEEKEKD